MAKVNRPAMRPDPIVQLPQPPLHKTEDYLTAYNGWVFAAVNAIAQKVASIDLKLYKRITKNKQIELELVTEHESLSLLYNVNDFYTFYDLVESTQVYLELVGEAYWVILKDSSGKYQEMWPLRPDWVKIVPDKNEYIKGYYYSPGGDESSKVFFEKDDIIPFKYFNPTNPYRGRGSVQAAAMEIDIDTFSAEWNRSYFFNAGIPSLLITTDKKPGDDEITRFLESWKSKFTGRGNQHKIAFLSGGAKAELLSPSARDMDFSEQRRLMRDSILAFFSVPKAILGITEDVNRANAEAADRSFLKNTILPKMIKFTAHLNEFYLTKFDSERALVFQFENPVPDDVETNLKIYENGSLYKWLTPNEIREREGYDPIEGGDEIALQNPLTGETAARLSGKSPKRKQYNPMYLPVKTLRELRNEKDKNQLKSELIPMIAKLMSNGFNNKQGKMSQEKREEVWKQFVAKTDVQEFSLKELIGQLFADQRGEVLSKVETLKFFSHIKRKIQIEEVLFNVKVETDRFANIFIPFIKNIILERGNESLDFLGVGGSLDFTDPNVAEYIKTANEVLTGINETTRTQLRETLAEGVGRGESIDSLRDRVKQLFDIATSVRAEMIARSEVIRASNFAAEVSYIQSGVVTGKEWLTSIDERVCPFCESMDGKIVDVGTLYFKNGDVMRVKDESGNSQTLNLNYSDIKHPPLHTSCRCTLIPVIATRVSGRSVESIEQKRRKLNKQMVQKRELIKLLEDKRVALLNGVREIVEGLEQQNDEIKASAEAEKKRVIEAAMHEVEVEKNALLSDLRKLRNKARARIR